MSDISHSLSKIQAINDPDLATYRAGVEEGKRITRSKILTHLEEAYMNKEVTRDSLEAKAILNVARGVSEYIRSGKGN
jgi:hypothetical protein